MSIGYLILHNIGIFTDIGESTEHFHIPVTSHSNYFCSRNLRVRREKSGDHLFLNVTPHNIDSQVSVLPVVTTSILKATYSQV